MHKRLFLREFGDDAVCITIDSEIFKHEFLDLGFCGIDVMVIRADMSVGGDRQCGTAVGIGLPITAVTGLILIKVFGVTVSIS